MNQNCTNNFTSTLSLNITTNSSNNLNFQDIITNPCFYGSIIIFIILLSCVITFIFILKSRKKWLFPKLIIYMCVTF